MMPLVAAPFREEVVLTLFDRLTHFPSSLRALAPLLLQDPCLGHLIFEKNAGGLFVFSSFLAAPSETAL